MIRPEDDTISPEVREKRREYQRKYYRANKEKADKTAIEWRRSFRLQLIEALGGKCVHCGLTDPVCLDFDHIHNDGAEDKKRQGSILTIIRNEPHRFQLLCKNCNWLKEYQRRMDKNESLD